MDIDIKKNDVVDISIDGMTDDGRGVGRYRGMAVFVPGVIPGERVKVVIIKVLKSYGVGKLLEIIDPSPDRISPKCPICHRCGGCTLLHMSYEAELEFKQNKVKECLKRIGGFDDLPMEEILPSPKIEGYRNKSQFPVTPEGIGMFAAGSHRLAETDNCITADESAGRILKAFKNYITKFGVSAYDETRGRGLIRHLCIRRAQSGVLVTVVTSGDELPHKDALTEELRSACPELTGIIQNINRKKTNVILGPENKTLCGTPYLTDTLGPVKFRISPLSFYQINSSQTERLYATVKKFGDFGGSETLLDLYCGIGTIGQYLSDSVRKIIGVEYVKDAVADARTNAQLNNIENAEYWCGKAEDLLRERKLRGANPDAAVLDPPRKGCDPALLGTLCEIPSLEKIIYVSCKPSTLARDLKILSERGFKPGKIAPVDMFPRTPHVETVALLTR